MKRNRITITCKICQTNFEVIQSRIHLAKFCSRRCYDKSQTQKIPWNKGKTWEEMYGIEKAEELRQLISQYSSGVNNPMYGKHHLEETKKEMAKLKENYIPWNEGKKFPGMFSHINRLGQNNAYVKYVLKEENITYEEYLAKLSHKKLYYRTVISITNLQPIYILENYNKRAPAPQNDAYHLDHIYPIIKGFENKIPPEIIGDISNLRFIPWKENLQKSDKLLESMKKEFYERCISY